MDEKRIFCGDCKRRTVHRVIAVETRQSEPNDDFSWVAHYHLARCAGCEAVNFAIESCTEEDYDYGSEQWQSHWKTYPVQEGERTPLNLENLVPYRIERLYSEVVTAVNSGQSIITAIGIRALIEAIAKDQKIKGATLAKLIDNLRDLGHLSVKQTEVLHKIRFLGNAAAHEAALASNQELTVSLDIVEGIFKSLYLHPEAVKTFRTGQTKPAVLNEDQDWP